MEMMTKTSRRSFLEQSILGATALLAATPTGKLLASSSTRRGEIPNPKARFRK